MTIEIVLLGATLVLALVQIFAAAAARTRQYGFKWNAGPRDEAMPPMNPIAGRLTRAQANLFETLPLFAAGVLAVHAVGREDAMTALGAQLYFFGRVVYLPLYVLGLPVIRSVAWGVSLAGLIIILAALFGLA